LRALRDFIVATFFFATRDVADPTFFMLPHFSN
jgi:hypothetical protein